MVGLWTPASYVQGGDPTSVNDASPAFAPGELGSIVAVKNTTLFNPGSTARIYQYVTLDSGANTSAVGQLTIWSLTDTKMAVFTVTNVGTHTPANSNFVAGYLGNASLTAGNNVFIQVGGIGPVLIESGSTPAKGNLIIPGQTTDGRSDSVAPATDQTTTLGLINFGLCLATKTTAWNGSSALPTDTLAGLLFPPRIGW